MRTNLIGKEITIIESRNATLKNIKGTIIDETKNTLSIQYNGTEKTVVKDQCVFIIDGKKIEGKDLTQRPEERIKR